MSNNRQSFERVIGGQEESLWQGISDVMSGLMMIFLFIAISFMVHTQQEKEEAEAATVEAKDAQSVLQQAQDEIEQMAAKFQNTREELARLLKKRFETEIQSGALTIDEEELSVVFSSQSEKESEHTFFDQGESRLPRKLASRLREFVPRYLEILYAPEFRDEIQEIRIEGHTSSEHSNPKKAFMENMRLSHNRAQSVLELVLRVLKGHHFLDPAFKDWATQRISASGWSSNKLIMRACVAGEDAPECSKPEQLLEDKEKSRRVTFRVMVNSSSKLVRILDEINAVKMRLDRSVKKRL